MALWTGGCLRDSADDARKLDSVAVKELQLEIVLRAKLLSGADDKNPEDRVGLGRRRMRASPGGKQKVMARERRDLDVQAVRSRA